MCVFVCVLSQVLQMVYPLVTLDSLGRLAPEESRVTRDTKASKVHTHTHTHTQRDYNQFKYHYQQDDDCLKTYIP